MANVAEVFNTEESRIEIAKVYTGEFIPGGEREMDICNSSLNSVPAYFRHEWGVIEETGEQYLALFQEKVVGEKLEKYDFEKLSLRKKMRLAKALAYAVNELHLAGYWIGDIHPRNIKIRGDRAVFYDLSTIIDIEQGPETDLEFFTPEMDPKHPAPPFGKHVDIHNLGTLLYKIDPVLFSEIIEDCQGFWKRRSAKRVLAKLEDLERDELAGLAKFRYAFKGSLFLLIASALFTVTRLAGAGVTQPLPEIKSERDVWELRHGWAEKSPLEKLTSAEHISKVKSVVYDIPEHNVDAYFLTEKPFLVVGGEPVGPGDWVRLQTGLIGYITNIRIDAVEVQTEQGVDLVAINLNTRQFGFSSSKVRMFEDENRVFIPANGLNAERVIRGASQAAGVKTVSISTGLVAGIWKSNSVIGWLQQEKDGLGIEISNGELAKSSSKDVMLLPVQKFRYTGSKTDLEEALNISVSLENISKEEFYLQEGKVSKVLEYLNLRLEIVEGVVTLSEKEKQ